MKNNYIYLTDTDRKDANELIWNFLNNFEEICQTKIVKFRVVFDVNDKEHNIAINPIFNKWEEVSSNFMKSVFKEWTDYVWDKENLIFFVEKTKAVGNGNLLSNDSLIAKLITKFNHFFKN